MFAFHSLPEDSDRRGSEGPREGELDAGHALRPFCSVMVGGIMVACDSYCQAIWDTNTPLLVGPSSNILSIQMVVGVTQGQYGQVSRLLPNSPDPLEDGAPLHTGEMTKGSGEGACFAQSVGFLGRPSQQPSGFGPTVVLMFHAAAAV